MAAARKMRAFKQWMKDQGLEWSDALLFATESGCAADPPPISVEALSDFKEGDVVAKIPKQSCLTVATSAASELIEEAELGGNLGLCFALMYEKILGADSKWFEYLQILPAFEPIPLLWSLSEIDSLLAGTELHKTVKDDKALVFEDWKECIKPVLELDSFELNPESFTVDEYFSAKSLIASRSFQVDEYHGYGMVPLADLFNHKTAAEDVHITTESDNDTGSEKEGTDHESDGDDDTSSEKEGNDHESDGDDEPVTHDSHSEGGDGSGSDLELSSGSGNESESPFLEIIMIKDVKAGAEVFNTYGHLGNAALLHRYGFTEADNPFDILNIDLDIVVQWSLSLFSCSQSRSRLSIWRKMGYSGCGDQDSEYFEISCDGEPQDELLVLLYIMLLPKDESRALDQAVSGTGETKAAAKFQLLNKEIVLSAKGSDPSKKLLLTPGVGVALSSLADARESLYGPSSLEEDVKSRDRCCRATEGKLYHSLMLRISERRILEKLRRYYGAIGSANGGRKRKGTET